jgi:predicted MPP superfamily phosphohydrolase
MQKVFTRRMLWIVFLTLNAGGLLLFLTGWGIFLAVQVILVTDLILLPAFLLGYSLRQVFRKQFGWKSAFRVLFALFVWGMTYYVIRVEPYDLQVREVVIEDARFTEPLTIVHLSDIQSNGIEDYEAQVFEKVKAMQPDLIVHTGDLVQLYDNEARAEELLKLADLFNTLSPPLGTFNVEGDTDFFDQLLAMDFDGKAKLTTLMNQSTALISSAGRPDIKIVGLTLFASRAREDAAGPMLETRDSNVFNIAIGHRPDYVQNHDVSTFDLCLAGHTHGGQVRIPGFGAIVTMSKVPRDWAWGFREVEGTQLNVSAGIGSEHADGLPSLRFNCPPEIVVIRIIPPKS